MARVKHSSQTGNETHSLFHSISSISTAGAAEHPEHQIVYPLFILVQQFKICYFTVLDCNPAEVSFSETVNYCIPRVRLIKSFDLDIEHNTNHESIHGEIVALRISNASDPREIRTPDFFVRSEALFPLSYRARPEGGSVPCGCAGAFPGSRLVSSLLLPNRQQTLRY
jgi:hypothetical protein